MTTRNGRAGTIGGSGAIFRVTPDDGRTVQVTGGPCR